MAISIISVFLLRVRGGSEVSAFKVSDALGKAGPVLLFSLPFSFEWRLILALASGIYRRYKKLFALDDDGLRRIEGILKKAASNYREPLSVTFHVEREDDRFYESESVDEILSDPNVPEHRIRMLAIELRKTAALEESKEREYDKVAWVVFDKDEPPVQTPDVRVHISSPDRTWALLLADELEPQVTRLFKVKKFPNWVFILFAPVFMIIGYRISIFMGSPIPKAIGNAVFTTVGFIMVVLLLMAHTAIAEKKFPLLRTLASEPLFLWGEEISHAADRDALRKNILWVVIVGFLVSLVAGLIPVLK